MLDAVLQFGQHFMRCCFRHFVTFLTMCCLILSNYYSVNSRMEQPQRILNSLRKLLVSWGILGMSFESETTQLNLLQELGRTSLVCVSVVAAHLYEDIRGRTLKCQRQARIT